MPLRRSVRIAAAAIRVIRVGIVSLAIRAAFVACGVDVIRLGLVSLVIRMVRVILGSLVSRRPAPEDQKRHEQPHSVNACTSIHRSLLNAQTEDPGAHSHEWSRDISDRGEEDGLTAQTEASHGTGGRNGIGADQVALGSRKAVG